MAKVKKITTEEEVIPTVEETPTQIEETIDLFPLKFIEGHVVVSTKIVDGKYLLLADNGCGYTLPVSEYLEKVSRANFRR